MVCPLRRFASRGHRANLTSPSSWPPLVELAALASVVRAVVSALVGYAVPIVASPFPADRDGVPSSSVVPSSKEAGVILVCASLSSRVGRVRVGPFACVPGRLPWGLLPLRDVDPASPLAGERPRLAYVPPTAFRTLSTASSSLSLADLFRSAATSRIPRRGCSPGQAVPPRRWPLPSRRWRRASVAGVTRRRQAASRRPQGLPPGRDPVRDLEGLARGRVRVPSRSSPSDSSCRPCPGGEPRLHPRPSRAPLECCARWPWRFDRPTASMLYL